MSGRVIKFPAPDREELERLREEMARTIAAYLVDVLEALDALAWMFDDGHLLAARRHAHVLVNAEYRLASAARHVGRCADDVALLDRLHWHYLRQQQMLEAIAYGRPVMAASAPKPEPRPHEQRESFDMASHLAGELMACWAGKASVEQMKSCADAAKLALALTDLWEAMGGSQPADEKGERELDEFYRRSREFLKLSADLVTALHELSTGTMLLDNTSIYKLCAVHGARADQVLALSAAKA
jgi:hypothetical protein